MTEVPPVSRAESALDEALAAPFVRLTEGDAAEVADALWGVRPDAMRRLDTERDDTFLVSAGAVRYVLKVAHPSDDPDVLDLQCCALLHAAATDPTLPLPRLVPALDGQLRPEVPGAAGEPRVARLLTYLAGGPLDYGSTDPTQRAAVGGALARLSLALADFEHPAAGRHLSWDLRQLGSLRWLVGNVDDGAVRALVVRELDRFDDETGARLALTRQQVVHHDFNPDNVLVDGSASAYVTGILDFGDLVRSSVVGDLAVALSYAIDPDAESVWAAAEDVAAGFEAVRPLTAEERDLLPVLVRARLAQRLILNSWLAASNPDNADYTGRSIARAGRALRSLT